MFKVVETLYGLTHRAGQRAGLARGRALLRHPRRSTASWSASSTSTSTRARPSAAAPGWTTPSRAGARTAASRRRSPISTAIFRAGRRQARAVHPRRSDHPVPRIRPRPAPPADAASRTRRVRHQRRGMGRGRTAQPVHGELLLGMGRAAAHDARMSIPAQPLPRALFDKMLAAKNFQSGMQTVRQIEFALFDMHLHYDFDPAGAQDAAAAAGRSPRAEVAVMIPPAYNRFPNNFSHIFAGGYARGLLQLQVGRSAVGRRLQPVRGEAKACGVLNPEVGHRFWTRFSRGRQPPGARIVHRLPRPRAEHRRAAAAQRHGMSMIGAAVYTRCECDRITSCSRMLQHEAQDSS